METARLMRPSPISRPPAPDAAALPVLAATLLLVAACAAPARALERPRVEAVRATAPIKVDGVLDEPDWARATPITSFLLIMVREGEAPSESTAVRILFDRERLYFGVRCWNRGPGRIRASLTPRDQCLDDDQMAVHLDTWRDMHRAYIFGVNPYGVQWDGILVGGDALTEWDGVWEAGTKRDSLGWTAEMAIPFRTLRFPAHGPGTWGLWFRRQITKNDEIASWPLFRLAEPGDVMKQAADLTGLDALRSGGRVDIQPYVAGTSSAGRDLHPDGTTGPWRHDSQADVGLDVKASLTPTMALNATLNPDYSQVEADALQIDVNQRFPLFYAEKRPFFLEGAEIFSTPINLVYTRRMADPAYGGKLVGNAGKLRLGAIALRDDGGGTLRGVGAGPERGPMRSGWFEVGRGVLDLGEDSWVGATLTGHQADVYDGPDAPGPLFDGSGNAVGAADTRLRLAHALFFSGQLAFSSTRLDSTPPSPILWAARPGPATGFERRRPGALRLAGPRRAGDSRTRLDDWAYSAELEYYDGTTEVQLEQEYFGPDFRAETGFISRVDMRQTELRASVMERPENRWLRSWEPIFETYVLHDHTGGLQEWFVSPMVDWKFQKQTHLHTMYVRQMERWQGVDHQKDLYILNLDNSLWRRCALSFESTVGDGIFYGPSAADSYRGWLESYVLAATARPTPAITAELSANNNRFWRRRYHEEVYDAWTLGAKLTWQLTRELYARVYPQYDTEAEHLDLDALVGYVLHPGSVIYLGWNSDLDRAAGHLPVTGRSAFAKLSYVFQR